MTGGPIALALPGPVHPAVSRLAHLLRLRRPVEPALLAEGRVALVHVEGAHLAARPDVPWVAVAHSTDRVRAARAAGAALVLALPGSPAAAVARPLPDGAGAPGSRPVSPFVRGRLRALRGLPAAVGVGAGDGSWSWDGVDGPVEAAGELHVPSHPAAVAPAVVATGAALPVALAWGAPTVTDAESAARAGAVPGRDVVVAGAGRELPAARRLAARDVRCAALSFAGRRAYEAQLDPNRLVLDVLAALGLHVPSPRRPYSRLEHAVEELGAPARSPVRERVYRRASGSLPAPPGRPARPPQQEAS